MSYNPFFNIEELETALLYENAIQCDLSKIYSDWKNAVALTDGKKVYINSDENLEKILPHYNRDMLKWLLWHEEYHKRLKHPQRYQIYAEERHKDITDDEVNIIMDILVHDSLAKMFPEITKTAVNNLAQMRDNNSLQYTFEGTTLEDMLDEWKESKNEGDKKEEGKDKKDSKDKKEDSKDKKEKSKEDSKGKEDSKDEEEKPSEDKKKDKKDSKKEEGEEKGHKETDWSKLNKMNKDEFISSDEAEKIDRYVEKIKRQKFSLQNLTKTLNGLATTKKQRSYSLPSHIKLNNNMLLKGRTRAKSNLYLVFDASGSMSSELEMFKEIIGKAVPQALTSPCEWFSGINETVEPNSKKGYDYYKYTFKEMRETVANAGYDDDGDRTLAICLEAEKKGFTPIAVTDGGGALYKPNVAKQLRRTVIVCPSDSWIEKIKAVNDRLTVIHI